MTDRVKGLIFDYGGTLDTGGRHWGKVMWQAYADNGVGVTEHQFRDAYVYAERTLGRNPIIRPDYTFRRTLDVKLALQIEHLCSEKSLDLSAIECERLRSKLLDDVYEVARRQTALSRGILTELHGKYPMALVSNFYGNINVVLDEFGLDGLFGHVIESAVAGVRKPDPRIFTLGVEALGLAPGETMVTGDSYDKDIMPAKAAGCLAVWFKGEGWTEKTYDETLPDAIITGLEQLTLNVLHDNLSK